VRALTRLVGQLAALLVTVVVALPRLVTGLGVLAGRTPRADRVMRVHVLVQRDEDGEPVATVAHAHEAVAWARDAFAAAGVHVVPVGWDDDARAVAAGGTGDEGTDDHHVRLAAAADDDPRFVDVVDEPATAATLDVACTARAWRADLGAAGAGFRRHARAAGGRPWPEPGAPVWVFAVRGFATRHLGCSLGPMTDYVTVRFTGEPTTLAHELGHACGLWHTSADTLMHRRPTRSARLTRPQVWLVRASRHVTRA
jgi:hypothetical protein